MTNAKPKPHFHAGQRVVCVDATPNKTWRGAKLLNRGKIYVIRAIDQRPGWQAPGWGVLIEGVCVVHPRDGSEWPMHPGRFRPVVERPTNIDVFKKLLTPSLPSQEMVQKAIRAANADVWKQIEAMTDEMERRRKP